MENEPVVTLEQVQELHAMLTGKSLPDGATMKQPALPPDVAFNVIWYLQEVLRVLPDRFEMCDYCYTVYDSHDGGHTVGDGDYDETDYYKDAGFNRDEIASIAGCHFCDGLCESNYIDKLNQEAEKQP